MLLLEDLDRRRDLFHVVNETQAIQQGRQASIWNGNANGSFLSYVLDYQEIKYIAWIGKPSRLQKLFSEMVYFAYEICNKIWRSKSSRFSICQRKSQRIDSIEIVMSRTIFTSRLRHGYIQGRMAILGTFWSCWNLGGFQPQIFKTFRISEFFTFSRTFQIFTILQIFKYLIFILIFKPLMIFFGNFRIF